MYFFWLFNKVMMLILIDWRNFQDWTDKNKFHWNVEQHNSSRKLLKNLIVYSLVFIQVYCSRIKTVSGGSFLHSRNGFVLWNLLLPCIHRWPQFSETHSYWRLLSHTWMGCDGAVSSCKQREYYAEWPWYM